MASAKCLITHDKEGPPSKLLGVEQMDFLKIVVVLMSSLLVWAGAHTLDPSSEQIEATNESDNPIDGPKINLIQEGPTGLIVEVYDITDPNLQLNCDDDEGTEKFAVSKNAVVSSNEFAEKIVEKYGSVDYPVETDSNVSVTFNFGHFTSNHDYVCRLYSVTNPLELYDQESITFEALDEPTHSYSNLTLVNDWDGPWLTWEDEGEILWDTVLLKDLEHSNYLSYSMGEFEGESNKAWIGGYIPSLEKTYLIGLEGPDVNGMENEVTWYKFTWDGERCTEESECPAEIELTPVEQ